MIYFFKKIMFFTKCFLILVMASISSTSFGDQLNIKKIIIDGEQRVSESFILNFLPDYQNEYAGGYTQDWITAVDPEDGQTYNILNYAADESWGPKMDGTMYRPWWSWIHADFTGDGVDDYGTEIPLLPQKNNVKDFFADVFQLYIV